MILQIKMVGGDAPCRMACASQTCDKGRKEENGRERCWKSLGGLAADGVNPVSEKKWPDKDKQDSVR